MKPLKESPSQTAGPYVHIGCKPITAGLEQRHFGKELGTELIQADNTGDGSFNEKAQEKFTIELRILDGQNDLVKDALVEIWQANPDGSYTPSKEFNGWGRQSTDLKTGLVQFETVKPGKTSAESAPHILVWIAARGINLALVTRIYFSDEDNAQDPVLALAGERANTLIAKKTDKGYEHTIHLQGENETVFFDV